MRTIACIFLLSCLVNSVTAQTLHIQITDDAGDPVPKAAVFAVSQKPLSVNQAKPKTITIDQIDKEFVNHLTVLQVGTAVLFPNHDNIRHHVYSFSSAKSFELPLYQGRPANPVVFDKLGAVNLGCNIHDWMSAYIYVVDTPYFAVTDAQGEAHITLPAGGFEISAWHPQLKSLSPQQMAITTPVSSQSKLTLTMTLKKSLRTIRMPAGLGSSVGYR